MKSNFVGSFYYSKTTRWAASWDDIPEERYIRPGSTMSTEELKIYFDTENKILSDYWWHAFDD
ncbi:hypothetical protein QE382_003833 [Sphingobacterium zeae]|uniref:Uncharacterized protein n=1 Tax=Sphingobacterium zeae TaxID=1776859 RepID=A0ABU0UAK3_9SPHI|nr:hypothetical protein [Sphingobacterium zeae]MDQ1151849.1 hypothetical protein [Sphingobacterium zeae]